MPNLIVAERHAQSGSSRELSSKRLRLLILVLLFACETSFGIKLICHRHHSLASWLSFHEPNNASFILKCREDTSKIEKGSQIPSQVTIVSGLEEWMAKCNRLSCILNGLRHEPKQHLLANSLLVLKWIFKKLLDELIDFIFQHYLPSSRTEPVPGLMTNMTENMVKIHQI